MVFLLTVSVFVELSKVVAVRLLQPVQFWSAIGLPLLSFSTGAQIAFRTNSPFSLSCDMTSSSTATVWLGP